MVAVIRFLASVVMMLSLGSVTLSLLPMKAPRALSERIALWLLLGSGLISFAVFWVSLVGGGTIGLASAGVLGVAATLYSAFSGWRAVGRLVGADGIRRPPLRWSWRADGFASASGVIVALLFVGLVWAACSIGLFGDGLAIWGMKARAFWLEGGVPLSYLSDASRQWSHLNYPLLVPLTEAWAYYFLGHDDEHFAQAMLLVFALCLLMLFYGSVRRSQSRRRSWGATLLLCSAPAFFRIAASSYADVPLSAFIFGSSMSLYFWLKDRDSSNLWTAAVLSALCMWVKREGAVVWTINFAAVAIGVTTLRGELARRRVKTMFTFLLPSLLVLPWFLLLAWRAVPDHDFSSVGLTALRANLYRAPTLVRLLLGELLSIEHWGVLWALFALAALYMVSKPGWIDYAQAYLAALVSVYIASLTATFLFSSYTVYGAHMATSIDRLVFHVTPTAIFFIADQPIDIRKYRFGRFVPTPMKG